MSVQDVEMIFYEKTNNDFLPSVGAVCSMSGKGDCWDNAPVESFFSTLKREMVSRETFETRKEARLAVFEWIEVWYNPCATLR